MLKVQNFKGLKYYQKVHLAISFLALTFFISSHCTAQDGEMNVLGKAYYQLIKDTMLKDTIPSSHFVNTLKKRVKQNEITVEEMNSIIAQRKIHMKSISIMMGNDAFVEHLELDLQFSWRLSKTYGKETVLRIMEEMPPNMHHNKRTLDSLGIPIAQENFKTTVLGYQFSAPVRLDKNRYIVYMSNYVALLNGHAEAIVFCVNKDGSYDFEYSFLLFMS